MAKCELDGKCVHHDALETMGMTEGNLYDLCNENPQLCEYRSSLHRTRDAMMEQRLQEAKSAQERMEALKRSLADTY